MVLGQAMDIAAETALEPLGLPQISVLQANKTGALIGWACSVGPVMAQENATAMWQFSTALGLIYQISDDILDVTGDAKTVGKRVNKDAEAGKATFVSVMGLKPAKKLLTDYVDRAYRALDTYGPHADALRDALDFVVTRDR